MSFDAQRLYELLPPIYRARDAEQGQPLKALLAVIAEQTAVLEEDLARLYDDQFIETCAEWVVPYIGDLVGARGIFTFPDASFSQRAQVANTLAYRRRKGTATALEQLARDVTGWNASVVEYFQRLATTQYLNHLRPRNLSFTSLRNQITISVRSKAERGRLTERTIRLANGETLERLATPFDETARTVDVRGIAARRGKHNIPNVGIHLWRVESFPARSAEAFPVDARRFRFDPLGRDLPLFNLPRTESEISHLAEPENVPMPLSRRTLGARLEDFYGPDAGLLVTPDYVSSVGAPGDEAIHICDLSDVEDAGGNVLGWAHMPADGIAIDPVLGRFALAEDADRARVDFQYGFVARMGGGAYGRAGAFASTSKRIVRVPQDQPTLQAALDALNGLDGVVEVQNSDLYFETPSVTVEAGATVELRAANQKRPVIFLDGDLTIEGGDEARFFLNGFWIAGGAVRVPATTGNRLSVLGIRHCALSPASTPDPWLQSPPAPPLAPVQLIAEIPNLNVDVQHSITGPLRVAAAANVSIANSIVDALSAFAIAYADVNGLDHGAPARFRNSTVIGQARADALLEASNTIFHARSTAGEAPVEARRLQEGCVRFSFVPRQSRVPRKHKCQPDEALAALAGKLGLESTADLPPTRRETIFARVKPVFTSLQFGHPAYGQLSALSAIEVREGGDDDSEMGAFHDLFQPQREANLRTRLDEYLRFGLEAGVLHAT